MSNVIALKPNRSGGSYMEEAIQLRKIKRCLDLNYELDREISRLLKKRRRELLTELEKENES